jgi:hypothetical protein
MAFSPPNPVETINVEWVEVDALPFSTHELVRDGEPWLSPPAGTCQAISRRILISFLDDLRH